MGNEIGIATLAYQLSQTVIISLLVSFIARFHAPIIAKVGSHRQALASLPVIIGNNKFGLVLSETRQEKSTMFA
jgi:hypothetical protein